MFARAVKRRFSLDARRADQKPAHQKPADQKPADQKPGSGPSKLKGELKLVPSGALAVMVPLVV